MEIETVAAVIRELTKKTVDNGCTEAEMLAAMEKIGKLMKTYNLTMDKVFLDKVKCIQVDVPIGKPIRMRKPLRIHWAARAVADFCDCRVWQSSITTYLNRGFIWQYQLSAFGLETDAQMFEYLIKMLDITASAELGRYKKSAEYLNDMTHHKRKISSFEKGFFDRIHNRLVGMTEQRKREEKAETKVTIKDGVQVGPGALIVVKQNKVADEFKKLGIKLCASKATYGRVTSGSAYNAGQAAANNVNFNRPLGGGDVAGYLA